MGTLATTRLSSKGQVVIPEEVRMALGLEVGFIHDARQSVGERGDDAIGRAGHPSGVCRAPEHVIGMEVEGEAPAGVVRHHGLVDVDGALRLPGGAARKVEQRRIFRVGSGNGESGVGIGHERAQVVYARQRLD